MGKSVRRDEEQMRVISNKEDKKKRHSAKEGERAERK